MAILDATPTAQGDVAGTPFCHLALYLHRRDESGTLVVQTENAAEAMVGFGHGRPVRARLPWAGVDLMSALLPLCALRKGAFWFFELDLIGEAEGALAGEVDPYTLLAVSLRDHARDDIVEGVLDRYHQSPLRLLAGRELERLRLGPEDQALIELMRAAPATPLELTQQAPLPEKRTRRLLYALIVTRLVVTHEPRSEISPRPEPATQTQTELRSVRRAFGRVDSGPLIPAWQRLASLRPPNVPKAPPSPSGRPSSRSSPTHQSIPVARTTRQSPPPTAGPASILPEADDLTGRVRRVDQLLQRGRADDALVLLEELLKQEPDQAALHGLHAFVLFEKHKAETHGLPRTVLDALKKALEIDPDEPRALYTRGLVCKQAGDSKKAQTYFKRVLQIDPKHLDAQREVRLAKLRGQ